MIRRSALTLSLIVLLSSGCVPAILAGGAYGVAATTSERGLGGTLDDVGIKTGVQKRWFEQDADLVKRLDVNVQEGRVLITGVARDAQQRLLASQGAWEVQGVKEVINEASIDGNMTLASASKDAWITTKLRTYLTFDSDIAGRNYTIETVNSVIYLMGYARSQDELSRVTAHANTISGVSKVVSYVRVGNGYGQSGTSSRSETYDSSSSGTSAAPASGGPITMQPIYGTPQ